ncbi:unnamed protein product [Bursaphelenchus xylophilus]|uniref:(pine wood nematode) hypothetical protein n=1 Tax=Bursaphelenchus xylophilus TaxID=6326 RepID=A0A1I7SWU3_BURXY|nr:unnamed protein product [Bursaphelenchus xylophilus]CAG9099925.1 unnamed protein product [Bursaphelenchus xylophilus]
MGWVVEHEGHQLILVCIINSQKLRFVQTIWRHGDRAPSKLPYPRDKYDEKSWPRGWSMLTNMGMRQMYELGTFYKIRYKNSGFVGREYNAKEVYIQSSESDRALQSAQAMLSGFYPPAESDLFLRSIFWQPIPIHGSPKVGKDMMLKPTSFDCPAYDDEYDLVKEKIDTMLMQKYQDVVEFLQESTGYGENITLRDVISTADIQLELLHKLNDQPLWIAKKWPQYSNNSTLDVILEIKRIQRLSQFTEPKLAKLRGGYLLGDWIKRLENIQNGTESRKLVMYSAHDGTLLALMGTMGVLDGDMIPYASALILEVTEDDRGKYYVQMYYRKTGYGSIKTQKNEPNLIKLKFSCGDKCLLNDFIDEMRPKAILNKVDMYQECGLEYCLREMEGLPYCSSLSTALKSSLLLILTTTTLLLVLNKLF